MIFDVLRYDGQNVSPRAYDDRRALLDALALYGPNWRTPRRLCAAMTWPPSRASTSSRAWSPSAATV
jgi:hypothetical protein